MCTHIVLRIGMHRHNYMTFLLKLVDKQTISDYKWSTYYE